MSKCHNRPTPQRPPQFEEGPGERLFPQSGLITQQRITPEKQALAKQLRKNMTPAERALWQRLRANRLDGWHFRRQQIIAGFIVDFYCHQASLVVEIDGPIHESQQEADAEREAILRERGLRIVRFSNREVMNRMNTVLQAIREALGEEPTPQPPPETGGGAEASAIGRGSHDCERQSPPPQTGEGLGEGSCA